MEQFIWIPLVLRFFQRFFYSTPSNSVLRELLNPGDCLGTPPASPAPPPPAGRSPSFWLPRNPQFRDLSQRGIHCPDVSVTLHVTGDVTLDSGSQWRHATWSFLMTTTGTHSVMSKSTVDSTVFQKNIGARIENMMSRVPYLWGSNDMQAVSTDSFSLEQ